MLDNFQLTAIVKERRITRLLRVPLHRELQDSLAKSWDEQHADFTEDIQEIEFNAGYTPERHERFSIQDYELPNWLAEENSLSVVDLPAITNDDAKLDATKGVVAFARNDRGEELMLFQNFTRSHVIRPGRSLLLQGDTYRTNPRPGLTLEGKLSAIFLPNEKKLLFQNFRTVNTFLSLAEFYEEASEHQVREILGHARLAPEDVDALATQTNQWFRKRFAMLRDSGLLDGYTAQEIKERSHGHDVDIQVVDERVVFPSDRNQAKRLLQFLNEEIFRGAITNTLFETNSKRKTDP